MFQPPIPGRLSILPSIINIEENRLPQPDHDNLFDTSSFRLLLLVAVPANKAPSMLCEDSGQASCPAFPVFAGACLRMNRRRSEWI